MLKPPSNVVAVFNSTCNYRCRFCANRLHLDKTWCWSYEDITTKLNTLWDNAEVLNIGGCGEVTTLPFFERLMDYFSTKPGKVCFSTNGYLLKPAMIRKYRIYDIVISLHSLNPETYNYLTGTTGRLPKVLDNVEKLAKRPRDYALIIVSVVTGRNVLESSDLARFTLNVGADEIRFLPLGDPVLNGMGKYDDDVVLPETTENFATVEEANRIMSAASRVTRGFLSSENRQSVVADKMSSCQSPTEQIVIDMSGEVQPCCFIPPTYGFGNVLKQPWEEVWNGPKYEEFRRQVKAGTCQLCLQHCKNWG